VLQPFSSGLLAALPLIGEGLKGNMAVDRCRHMTEHRLNMRRVGISHPETMTHDVARAQLRIAIQRRRATIMQNLDLPLRAVGQMELDRSDPPAGIDPPAYRAFARG